MAVQRTDGTITRLLASVGGNDAQARDALWSAVYKELHEMAAGMMALERAGHTLQPTALVSEAYMRLLGGEKVAHKNRAYFFAAAAEAMRRILIEHARKRASKHKTTNPDVNSSTRTPRAGGATDVLLQDLTTHSGGLSADSLLELNEALDALAKHNRQVFDMIMLRFFAGLTIEAAAMSLGISPRTARRYWTYGRTWLYRRIGEEDG